MDSGTGLIIKLCVFALDIFIIVFNFITLKHYLPSFGRDNISSQIETRNKGQQTYLASDVDGKPTERRQNYAYRNQTNNLANKVLAQNCTFNRTNANTGTRHNQKCYADRDRDRDYRKEEKYAKSVCHCDVCKDGKRLTAK